MSSETPQRSNEQFYSYDSDNEGQTLHIDRLKSKKEVATFVYIFATVVSLGSFLHGYDMGVVSGCLLLLRKSMALNPSWQEAIVSISVAASAISAVLCGLIGNNLGRKRAVLISCVTYTIGAVCLGAAPDKYVVLVGKFITGLSIGVYSSCVPVYMTECFPSNIAGWVTTINATMLAAGILVGNVVDGFFAADLYDGWRYMFGLGAIPSAIQFILGVCLLPESPAWLLGRGRDADAIRALQKLRGYDDIDEEFEIIKTNSAQQCSNDNKSDLAIVKNMWSSQPLRRAIFVGCFLQFVQQFTGISAIMYYSAIIINMMGIKSERLSIWLSAVAAFLTCLGTFLGLILAEKRGRRVMTLASVVGTIFGLVWLAIGFQVASSDTADLTVGQVVVRNTTCYRHRTCHTCIRDSACGFCYRTKYVQSDIINGSCLSSDIANPWIASAGLCNESLSYPSSVWAYNFCPTDYSWMPLLGLLLFDILYSTGMNTMPDVINAELYPPWARDVGQKLALTTQWICNLLVTMTFLTLGHLITVYGTFWLYASVTGVGTIVLIVVLPETRNKTSEELETLFKQTADSSEQPPDYNTKTVQYVHIHGLNRDGVVSELDSPE